MEPVAFAARLLLNEHGVGALRQRSAGEDTRRFARADRAGEGAAGGTIDFWRTALRPGKPMMAGRLGETMVLGLPGNPVSAFVTALLFVKPLIAAMAGARDPLPRTYAAPLGEAIPANGERTDYLRAELVDGRAYASTIQDSSMLLTLARAGCLIVRPPHAPPAAAGEIVEIVPLA
jgi:molybdopterin molybdotransferase